MANNCLVTKLNEVVENDSLNFLGMTAIHVKGARSFNLGCTEATKISIKTPGVTFTNSGASGATEQTIPASTGVSSTTVSVSDTCDILIHDKYSLRYLNDGASSYIVYDLKQLNYCINLQQLIQVAGSQSYGDLSELKKCSNMQLLQLRSPNLTGNLEDLFESDETFNLDLGTYSFSTKIVGDISNLLKVPNIMDITMEQMGIYGNISVFENLSKIRDVSLAYNIQGINGNISSFANHSSLRSLSLYLNEIVVGNLGSLVNVPALKSLVLPNNVEWTDTDAARIDAIVQGNGGTQSQSNYPHYFGGGKHVDSYSS